MNISSLDQKNINNSTRTATTEKTGIAEITTDATQPSTSSNQTASSVSLSGRALMLSRLYRTTEQNFVHPVPLKPTIMGHSIDFLTHGDLDLLSEMYAFAQESGANFWHVDQLADSLGWYRQLDNGKNYGSVNNGGQLNADGYQVTWSFNEKDTDTAKRILEGEAFKTTRLDKGFLQFAMNPGLHACHREDFEFVEQMVNKFSDRGESVQKLDPKFASFTHTLAKPVIHLSAEPKPGFGKKDKLLAAQLQDAKAKDKAVPNKALEQPEKPKSLQDIMRMLLRQALSVGTWHTSLAAFLMRNKH